MRGLGLIGVPAVESGIEQQDVPWLDLGIGGAPALLESTPITVSVLPSIES
jgi:hypothetical protein